MSEQGITGAANNARVLDLTGVQRTFYQGRNELKVLRGVDLVLRQGEIVALVGPSGSGKSTLLHIAGLLEPPDAGDVAIAGQSCNGMNDLARTTMRREHLGFVYQNHHLLPEFSALENVAIPAIIDGLSRGESKKRWPGGKPAGRLKRFRRPVPGRCRRRWPTAPRRPGRRRTSRLRCRRKAP